MEFHKNVDYLAHHGILGMKWGVRRYQNSDGTLTEAGRRRYSKISDNEKKVSFDDYGRIDNSPRNLGKASSALHDNVSKDYRDLSSIQQYGSSIARTGSTSASRGAQRKRENAIANLDLSEMSDKELRDAVNRLNLERSYKQMVTENVAAGQRQVSDILATVGDALTVGASAAAIAASIHNLMS